MTDSTEQTEPTEQTEQVEQQDQESQTTDTTEQPDTANKAGREAAKYRRQLRDTEAERDTLRQQLDAARRSIVASSKAAARLDPAAREAAFADVDVNTMFNNDGTTNTEAIQAHVQNLRTTAPYMFPSLIIPNEGKTPSDRSMPRQDFSEAFSPPNTR